MPSLNMRQNRKYLGLSKSNVVVIVFPYKRVKKKLFFYRMIEKMKLYFSILFHRYPTGIILIKFRAELFLYETYLWYYVILSFISVKFWLSLFFFSVFFLLFFSSLLSLSRPPYSITRVKKKWTKSTYKYFSYWLSKIKWLFFTIFHFS